MNLDRHLSRGYRGMMITTIFALPAMAAILGFSLIGSSVAGILGYDGIVPTALATVSIAFTAISVFYIAGYAHERYRE